jgi:hypothetical protein
MGCWKVGGWGEYKKVINMSDWKQTWKKIADVFDSRLNLSLTQKYKNVGLFAHGDGDGIASAVFMYEFLKPRSENIEIIWTKPHLIGEHTHTNDYDLIVVVDIAINNRDPHMTRKWIQKHQKKLIWIDHHMSYFKLRFPNVIIKEKDSCIELIQEMFANFNMNFNKRAVEVMKYGHLSDIGQINNRYYKALKINLKADETRDEIFGYATKHPRLEKVRICSKKIDEKAKIYDERIAPNTRRLFNSNSYVVDNTTFIDIRNCRTRTIDKTLLAFIAYENSDFCIIKYYNNLEEKREYLNISVKPDISVNLLKTFNLQSGAKYRITRPNIKKKIKSTFWKRGVGDKRIYYKMSVKWQDKELVEFLNSSL